MKILIFTVTIGSGHNIVARNMATELESRGHEVKVVKMFDNAKFTSWYLKWGFGLMGTFCGISNRVYDKDFKKGRSLYNKKIKLVKDELIPVVNDFGPDVILSSHIAGRLFVEAYEKHFTKPVLNCFIMTDYDATPSLVGTRDNEIVFIPNDDFKPILATKGVDESCVYSCGIPINPKFFKAMTKQEAIAKLNLALDNNKRTVLVTGGGNGISNNIVKAIKHLSKHDDLQIILVTGKNEKLKKQMDRRALKSKAKLIVLGFVDNMDVLMSASDFFVGKAGGLSATEAIAKGIPLLTFPRTPKPEFANLKYFVKRNMAAEITKVKNIYQILNDLNIELMKENYQKYAKPDSAKLIAEHVEKFYNKKKSA